MTIDAIPFILKDGRQAVLRNASDADAQGLINYLQTSCGETNYLLRTPEETASATLDGEIHWIADCNNSPNCLMLVCEVDGVIAGNCEIRFGTFAKKRHRGEIGIGLMQKYWNLGIGTAMLTALEKAARNRQGTLYMDLEFLEGNARARALYEKMGFQIICVYPKLYLQPDGLKNAYWMRKELN